MDDVNNLHKQIEESLQIAHFMGMFCELVNVHLDVIDMMVKLARFLKLEIDLEIIDLVKMLEGGNLLNILAQVHEMR